MSLKKLQEKCKKNQENKITLYSTKSIRTSLNNNKKQINFHQKKESCPFLYDYKCQGLEFQFLNPRYVQFEYIARWPCGL